MTITVVKDNTTISAIKTHGLERPVSVLALAVVSALTSVPAHAYQPTQQFNQAEQRAANGQLMREEALITVVACNGPGETGGQRYIYQYLRRSGFRAINPPNWGQPLGGRDWASFEQAAGAGCMAQASAPAPAPGPANVNGAWRLTTGCRGWDGLAQGQTWAAILSLASASDGSLKAASSNDPLRVEFVSGRFAGNQMNLTLHPSGWASNLELTGTLSGATIAGRLHHYGGDDCQFQMIR